MIVGGGECTRDLGAAAFVITTKAGGVRLGIPVPKSGCPASCTHSSNQKDATFTTANTTTTHTHLAPWCAGNLESPPLGPLGDAGNFCSPPLDGLTDDLTNLFDDLPDLDLGEAVSNDIVGDDLEASLRDFWKRTNKEAEAASGVLEAKPPVPQQPIQRPPPLLRGLGVDFASLPTSHDNASFTPEVEAAEATAEHWRLPESPRVKQESPLKRTCSDSDNFSQPSQSRPLSPRCQQQLQQLEQLARLSLSSAQPLNLDVKIRKGSSRGSGGGGGVKPEQPAPRRKRKSPNNGVKIHRVTKWQREKRGLLRACLWELRFWNGQITELSRRYDIPIRTLRRYKLKSINPESHPGANDNSALLFHTFPGESIPRPPREVQRFIPGFMWHAFEGDEPFPQVQ